ncbi:MAG: hypothetical protein JST80_05305 [Bdellovibrionales bacterium]|nr:hypothetical protein [Bdellovibrionales bacterium]
MTQHQEWLIRTKDLYISRPVSREELVKKIEKGDLNPLDEVCPANGYWFGLHEAEEVRRHLGDIDLTRLTSGIEIEITSSTETHSIAKTKILEIPKTWTTEALSTRTVYTIPETPLGDVSHATKPKPKATAKADAEKQWAPAIIFAVIFIVVLMFLWMNSD